MAPTERTPLLPRAQLLLEQARSWSGSAAGGWGFRLRSGLVGMKTSGSSFRLADRFLSLL